MKYIRGFLMAWGMFCWIPCPYRQWRMEDRRAQIGMLPLVGLLMGVILCVLWKLMLMFVSVGLVLAGVLLTGAYFLMTGFIHLDGFMDCSDAIMPRHPSLEERRRILKDSHSGAFALICAVILFMVFAASLGEVYESAGLPLFAAVVCVLTCSRTVSAVSVLVCRPMETSQYVQTQGRGRETAAPVITAALAVALSLCAVRGTAGDMLLVILPAAVTVAAALVAGFYDRKKLEGMNGDISGHMITLSEMAGILTAALMI
ncbi:MAG: adenosylcobinamide-GDP ribazoletransferase [Lentihominibacter sp.]